MRTLATRKTGAQLLTAYHRPDGPFIMSYLMFLSRPPCVKFPPSPGDSSLLRRKEQTTEPSSAPTLEMANNPLLDRDVAKILGPDGEPVLES